MIYDPGNFFLMTGTKYWDTLSGILMPVHNPFFVSFALEKQSPCREILPLSGKIFFITAESAEIAEKKSPNLK